MTNGDQNTREILTVKQAAEWLQVTTETVLTMIHKGLPAIKVGKGYRISKPAIKAYMTGGEGADEAKQGEGSKSKKEELQEQLDIAKLEIDLAEILKTRGKPEQLKQKEEELNRWAALLESMAEDNEIEEAPDKDPGKDPGGDRSIAELLKGLGNRSVAEILGKDERAMKKRHKDTTS